MRLLFIFFLLPLISQAQGIWGPISGDITSQTDLINRFNAKEPTIASGTATQYVRGDKSVQTHNMASVSDVTILSIANNQLLKWNSTTTKWENWTPDYITQNQVITLSGDLSGSGATSIAATIAANAITNAKMAQMANNTLKGNVSGAAATPSDLTASQVKTMLALENVTNTSDANKPVSTAQQTALDLKANLTALTNTIYFNIAQTNGSHTAARVAGTYWLGEGQPAGITGTGTLYAPQIIYLDPTEHPTVNGVAADLRIRVVWNNNDVAPTGTYIFGLYPVTRPATSGGAGLNIFTMGTVVTGSQTTTISAPAADNQQTVVTSDFAVPTAGYYVIGFIQTGTVAASSHIHINAYLQRRWN